MFKCTNRLSGRQKYDQTDYWAFECRRQRCSRTWLVVKNRTEKSKRCVRNNRRDMVGNGHGQSSSWSVRSAHQNWREASSYLRTDIFALGKHQWRQKRVKEFNQWRVWHNSRLNEGKYDPGAYDFWKPRLFP